MAPFRRDFQGDGERAEASEPIANLARNREFESISLQQRVNKLSVPLAISGDSRKQLLLPQRPGLF